ncbi:LysR family transcriptional regulator substrate-binding protein [Sutterella wadsworthensis]|uniref:LysR family transcriptional regulator substrate-binding protein n=1 Tax=Sutterella wadsworthensis TaxID=40545 RepID=UPI001D0774F9|nr:LysR family transcriptional regulator substrate-binding protein [Sutterella wadsworthensis]
MVGFYLTEHNGLFFIPEAFFQNFCERCPNAKLRIVRPTSDIFEMLRSGEADFGFSYRAGEPEDSGIHSYPIYTGKAIVVVRKGHPLEEVNASRMLSIGDLRPFTVFRQVKTNHY